MAKSKKRAVTRKRAEAQRARRTPARAGRARAIASLLDEMRAAGEGAGPAARGVGGALAAAEPPGAVLAAVPAQKAVTFTCSNAQCLVGITVGSVNVVFTGTGGSLFPVGTAVAHWRVKGTGKFSVTATGATLGPIASTAPDAGLANFVVAP